MELREVSFFTGRGALDNWEGIRYFSWIKRGDHLYFLKKYNILLNISEHK